MYKIRLFLREIENTLKFRHFPFLFSIRIVQEFENHLDLMDAFEVVRFCFILTKKRTNHRIVSKRLIWNMDVPERID